MTTVNPDTTIEARLPAEILAKADFRYGEYAWKVADLPEVIAAAVELNLLNLGGQLQFRIEGSIGECDWVDADPCVDVPADLPWDVRVRMAAELSLRDLKALQSEYDFHQEVREAFAPHIEPYLATGGTIEDATWFVWYLMDEAGDLAMKAEEGDAEA